MASTLLRLTLYAVAVTPLLSLMNFYPTWLGGPLSPLLSTYYPHIVPKTVIAHVLIEISVILYLVVIWKRPETRPQSNVLTAILLIYLIVTFLTAFTGVSSTRSIFGSYQRMTGALDIAHWVAYAIMLGGIWNVTGNNRHFFLNLSVIVASIVAVIGIIEWTQTGSRVGSTLGNPLYLGGYCAVMAVIAVKLGVQHANRRGKERTGQEVNRIRHAARSGGRKAQKRGGRRFHLRGYRWSIGRRRHGLYIGMVGLLVAGVMVSGSRSSVLALIVAVLIIGGWYVFKFSEFRFPNLFRAVGLYQRSSLEYVFRNRAWCRNVRFWNGVIGLLVVVGVAGVSYLEFSYLYSGATPFQGGGWADRHEALRVSVWAWQDKPIVGYGPENFHVGFVRYSDPAKLTKHAMVFDSSHNQFVDELVEKGVIGLCAYLGLLAAIGYALRKDVFMLAAFVALVVQLSFVFDTLVFNLMMAVFIGYGAKRKQPPSVPGERRILTESRRSL